MSETNAASSGRAEDFPAPALPDDGFSDDADALLSRLELIEQEPLGDRAPAYVQLHDELRSHLEGRD